MIGREARRLLYEDPLCIGRLGCVRTQETVFAAEGRLRSAYAEGMRFAEGTGPPTDLRPEV